MAPRTTPVLSQGNPIGLTVIFDIVFIHCVSHTFIRQERISGWSLLAWTKELSRREIKELDPSRRDIKDLRSLTMFRTYAFSLKGDCFCWGKVYTYTDRVFNVINPLRMNRIAFERYWMINADSSYVLLLLFSRMLHKKSLFCSFLFTTFIHYVQKYMYTENIIVVLRWTARRGRRTKSRGTNGRIFFPRKLSSVFRVNRGRGGRKGVSLWTLASRNAGGPQRIKPTRL